MPTSYVTDILARQTLWAGSMLGEGNGMDYEARARDKRRQMRRAGAQCGRTRGAAQK